MNQAKFAHLMETVFQNEISALRKSGQAEYAGGAYNAFGNFDRLAIELNSTPEKVLWTYAMKHKDGIAAYIRGHISQRESVEGRINDLIVYLFLLRGMIERGKGSSQHSSEQVSRSPKDSGESTGKPYVSEDRPDSLQ